MDKSEIIEFSIISAIGVAIMYWPLWWLWNRIFDGRIAQIAVTYTPELWIRLGIPVAGVVILWGLILVARWRTY